VRSLRAAFRLLHAALLAVRGWLTIVFAFPRLSLDQRSAEVQRWSRKMLKVLGIELRVQGVPPARGPVLLVANHISWLDILVIHAAAHCRFVSKADVKSWPLIGTMATGAGTLYIERESRRDALRVVHHMAESLERGEIVAVFPEGTTSEGADLLPFHGNLIQAAISANVPVQPVALDFVQVVDGRRSLDPCYVGDDTLLGSVWRTLSGPPLAAVVRFGGTQNADGRGRRQWASDLRMDVSALRG
jgi:1-acyl-sn-glycerol-3-phosphate acyltransferase